MKILLLDDENERQIIFLGKYPWATCVKTSDECIHKLKQYWDIVCLDHDLENGDTGMNVVKWIISRSPMSWPSKPPIFVIHSTNLPMSVLMIERLTKAGYSAIYIPFGNPFGNPYG